jgi:hypothetical protein
MGSVVRAISKAVGISKPKPPPVQQVAKETASQKQTQKGKQSAIASSSYGGSTMLTGSEGITEEANVGKTVLGGGKEKKKKVVA